MGSRFLATLVVVLSLTAPPAVDLACAWACGAGTHHAIQAASHHHADMDVADVQISGQHACNHDLSTVERYLPPTKRLPAASDGIVAVAPSSVLRALLDQRSTVGGWNLPDDRALSPPGRSLVLRI